MAANIAPTPKLNLTIEGMPQLHLTIEGLRAQIIANATMVFTVPATLYDKEDDKVPIVKHQKDIIFEVVVCSDSEANRQPHAELFQATLVSGDLYNRNALATGLASNSVGGAMNSLLRLVMAELGTLVKAGDKRLLVTRKNMAREEGIVNMAFM